jgi:hypothetical protein
VRVQGAFLSRRAARGRLAELPALSEHHLLEGDAADTFGVADEGDFSVLKRAGVLVGNDSPVRAAVPRHCNDKGVGSVNSLGRPGRVVVRRHEAADDALDGNRLLEEELGLRLGPCVAVVAGAYLIEYGLGRSQAPGIN